MTFFVTSRAPNAAAEDLRQVRWSSEPAFVLSRWTVNGDVQRAGFGVAQLHAMRELRMALDRANLGSRDRRWRAWVYAARLRQSLVLGTESVLESQPTSADFVRVGTELHFHSAEPAQLAVAAALPRIEVTDATLSDVARARASENCALWMLPLPEQWDPAHPGAEQQARWDLPESGGSLWLSWHADQLQRIEPRRWRLEAQVQAQWWRSGAPTSAAPTRTGEGRASWEFDPETSAFRGFDLDLELPCEPDAPGARDVHAIAKLRCEVEWREVDWPALSQRSLYLCTQAMGQIMAHTARHLRFGPLRWPPRCEAWFADTVVRAMRTAAAVLHP